MARAPPASSSATTAKHITLVQDLQPGHDEIHMRYYIRSGADYGYHGHGGGGLMAGAGKGGWKGAESPPTATSSSVSW